MTEHIDGKIVVIAGANSGLDETTVRHLAQARAKLVLGVRRLDRLQALAGGLGLLREAVRRQDTETGKTS